MSEKPTRATVQICPDEECGGELEIGRWLQPFRCTVCGELWRVPDYGYYPIDVTAVVKLADRVKCGHRACKELVKAIREVRNE